MPCSGASGLEHDRGGTRSGAANHEHHVLRWLRLVVFVIVRIGVSRPELSDLDRGAHALDVMAPGPSGEGGKVEGTFFAQRELEGLTR